MHRLKISLLPWFVTATLLVFIMGNASARANPPQNLQVSVCKNGRILFSQNPGSTENILRGVATISYKNVWAVGHYQDDKENVEKTLIEHWDGKFWNLVPSPNVRNSFNFLYGVSAVSSNDIWAVGFYYTSNRGTGGGTLIEHWDGTSWSIVPSPNVGSDFNNLYAVAAVSSSDVWAVGDEINADPSQDNTLIEHWDGKRWRVVSSPNPGKVDNTLRGIAVVSANDIWAVGNYSKTNGHNQTLTEHWNGRSWSVVSSPNVGAFSNFLKGVSIVSSSDIWAVGYHDAPPGDVDLTLIEHWNGKQWRVVSSPDPNPTGNYLNAVEAFSASNVWAVGYDYNNGGSLIEQWNGTSWSVVPSKNQPNVANTLLAVSADNPSDIWTVGFYIKHHEHQFIFQTLIEHYCP